MQIFDKSEIILSSLVSSRCSEIPDHGVAHLGRVEVGFLNKLHDNRKELVATLKPGVYLRQVDDAAVAILVDEVGKDILHVRRKALDVSLEGIADLVGRVEQLPQ